MKNLLFLVFVSYSLSSFAQNYQCFQNGIKHYFVNDKGYLRGIKIDSVSTGGGDTTYYPFKTLRISVGTGYDKASGSWLGKKVIRQADGAFLFGNYHNDTVIIKTSAHVGDSWTFYNDTSAYSYIATVISTDTMTILGVPDSIKTINITAYYSGSLNPADSINNFNIILSKNNGFVQVFNLFTFPVVFDDYLYASSSYQYADAIFKIADYHPPTFREVYDFSPGDVFVHTRWITSATMQTLGNGVFYDSIVSRSVPDAYHIVYSVAHKENIKKYSYASLFSLPAYDSATSISSNIYTLTADTTHIPIFDQMPEEYNIGASLFYQPYDSAGCYHSTVYNEKRLRFDTSLLDTSPIYQQEYKTGFFLLQALSDSEDWDDDPIAITYQQVFSVKNGIPCGTRPQLKTANVEKISLNIYPNPANNELILKTGFSFPYTASLVNIFGQTMQTRQCNSQQETMDTSQLPDGIYILIISEPGGNKYSEKVMIRH